jgi:hypothetical protein
MLYCRYEIVEEWSWGKTLPALRALNKRTTPNNIYTCIVVMRKTIWWLHIDDNRRYIILTISQYYSFTCWLYLHQNSTLFFLLSLFSIFFLNREPICFQQFYFPDWSKLVFSYSLSATDIWWSICLEYRIAIKSQYRVAIHIESRESQYILYQHQRDNIVLWGPW